jgi:hypothetical protein
VLRHLAFCNIGCEEGNAGVKNEIIGPEVLEDEVEYGMKGTGMKSQVE